MTRSELPVPDLTSIDLGTIALPAVAFGRPGGTASVMIPGLTDGLAPLTEPSARLLLADLPLPTDRLDGLALSHRVPAAPPLTTRLLAGDVAAAIERWFPARPVVVFGHSMGAMVAQHLAADRPELVAALVLSAPAAHADDAFRRVLALWATLVRRGEASAFALEAIGASFTGHERDVRERAARRDPPDPPSPVQVARHLALSAACGTHDARDRLAAIDRPTLLLAGERDEICPPRHARELAAAIVGAELEVFPAVGHGFPEQVGAVFRARVARFLDRVATGAAGAAR